ncbi:MAG: hypothetical protein ABEJ36_01690 [Candidatus Nanosalina sp.]
MASEDEQFYVRIDGSEEILDDLNSLETRLENINEASEILKQIRAVREKAIDTIYSNVQELEEELDDIEMNLPEVEAQQEIESNIPEEATAEQPEVDNSVEEIHEELESLQEELSKLGNQ